jgi:hypothetical protein
MDEDCPVAGPVSDVLSPLEHGNVEAILVSLLDNAKLTA